ncbi:hypothetical protein Tco_1334996 [Tanacetum coccineum]
MANKHSIMTREMVESFCDSYYIPDEVHPTAPGRDRTITQFPEGKVGVYTRLFDYCGYRIPLTKFFVSVLKHFRIHISQLSPFGAARISHFEVLTRVLDLGPSVAVFRAFYTRMYSDGLFSFAKRSLSAPSCLSKPPDSIKNWADHFFWVDSRVFPISVPLYTGGVLEKDPAPHLTARQEQAVQVLSSNKAPFRRYPECFLALVGLSPYYPFGENTYPAFEGPDRTDMGLLDYIRTADPRKVQAVEVQKGEEQVTLFDSIKHCFVSLDAPAAAHQASGSGSGAGAEVSVSSAKGNVVEENPEKAKRKKLLKRSDPLPAKRLRTYHSSLASGTGGKSLASLRQSLPEGSLTLGASSPADIPTHVTVPSSRVADVPVFTAADIVTSSRVCTEHELELKRKLQVKFDCLAAFAAWGGDGCFVALKSTVFKKDTESLFLDFLALHTLKSALVTLKLPLFHVMSLELGFTLSLREDGLVLRLWLLCLSFLLRSDFKESGSSAGRTGSGVVHVWSNLKAHVIDVSGLPRVPRNFGSCLRPSRGLCSRVADAPVYTAADTVTSSRGKTLAVPTSDVGGSSQPETSEESADSFYETAALNSEDAKRWYIPRWNITNDSLLDDGFSCRTLICLGSEVRSRTEHELELKEKLRAKYDAPGMLLREKDAEIARLKSLMKEKETESAEVSRLRDQVSVMNAEKSSLSAEVLVLKSAVSQKETDISLLDSRATYLKSALDDSQAVCDEARNLISSLSSERDGLASEV